MDALGFGLMMCVGIWVWFPEEVGKNLAKTVKAYRRALQESDQP